MVDNDSNMHPEASNRISGAMNAYSPTSQKVFGSPELSKDLKLDLADSLVFSRLFMNGGIWPRMNDAVRRKFNTCYLRVLRRIHGTTKANGGWKIFDIDILREVGAPSMDDRLCRMRLLTLEVFLNRSPPVILLLLQTRGRNSEHMPWVSSVRDDLRELFHRQPVKFSSIGDPIENSGYWLHMIQSCPSEWRELVKLAFPLRQHHHRWLLDKPLNSGSKCFVPGAVAHDLCESPNRSEMHKTIALHRISPAAIAARSSTATRRYCSTDV